MDKVLFSCFLFLFSVRLLAQDTLSGRVTPGFNYETEFFSRSLVKQPLDTGLNQAELYNPMVKEYRLYQDLGNIGTPGQPLLFSPYRNFGFQLGTQAMQQYHKQSKDTRYFRTRHPYTDIQYVQGSKELLFLDLVQTQNINKRWNIGVDFRRISSLGFYTNQKSSIWSTRVFSAYESKNQRYVMLNNIIWNKGFAEMNGGLQNDTSFENLSGTNKQVGVNLQGAGTDGSGGPRNYFRNTSFHTSQFWYWGNYEKSISGKDTLTDFYSRAGIKHAIDVERYSFLYRDNQLLNKGFYPVFNFDTTRTYDSTHLFSVQNSLTLFTGEFKKSGNSGRKFRAQVSMSHQYIEISQRTSNIKFNNVSTGFIMEHVRFVKIQPYISLDYCASGYNKGDYTLITEARTSIKLGEKFITVFLQGYRSAREQNFLTNRFESNHYLWKHNFDKTHTTNVAFGISQLKETGLKFRTSLNVIDQLVYFDTIGMPIQSGKQVQVITASLSKSFRFGNFHLNNQLWYQYTNNKQVMRLPEFGLFERFYYEKRLFKKVLLMQVGVDVSFFTSYYAQEFNPVTRQFQMQDKVKIGNYPLADIFLNMQIKRANLFFKFEHANADLSGNRYYSSPHQPLPYRAFRLGIRWRMYD